MKRRKVIIVGIIVAAVLLIARRKVELSHAPVVGARPIMVHTVSARKRDIRDQREYLAEVQPARQAHMAARINAQVDKVYVDEGSVVRRGDLLAALDQRDLKAKLAAAEAELSSAAENLSYWRSEYERDEDLFKNGAISEEERDRARNNLASARARDARAKENVALMKTGLSYAAIRAPFDGVVAGRLIDPGDLAVVGKPLFILDDRSRMKLVFEAPQEDLPFLKKGEEVSFLRGGKTVEVPISNIFPSLEKGKLVTVEAILPGRTGYVSGEFVPISVTVSERKDVTVVPKGAVVFPDGEPPFVFLVANNRLKRFPVEVGMVTEDWVEVKNIQPGQAVVDGSYLSWSSLSDGQTVVTGSAR